MMDNHVESRAIVFIADCETGAAGWFDSETMAPVFHPVARCCHA